MERTMRERKAPPTSPRQAIAFVPPLIVTLDTSPPEPP